MDELCLVVRSPAGPLTALVLGHRRELVGVEVDHDARGLGVPGEHPPRPRAHERAAEVLVIHPEDGHHVSDAEIRLVARAGREDIGALRPVLPRQLERHLELGADGGREEAIGAVGPESAPYQAIGKGA